jgi:adenine deaminase
MKNLLIAALLVGAGPANTLAQIPENVPTATRVAHPIAFSEETKIRQSLVAVALGHQPADLVIRGATVLNVYTLQWDADQDIVVSGKRIAWVGPEGQWKGQYARLFDAKGLWAVPGFGESHKHIESTLLSPEWEAALVIPLGNTWTTEGSHEFSNVSGVHNVEFWQTAAAHGSPLKIFTALGSATPPSAFEVGGGNYAYQFIRICDQTVQYGGTQRKFRCAPKGTLSSWYSSTPQ